MLKRWMCPFLCIAMCVVPATMALGGADVIVGDLIGVAHYGPTGSIHGYAVGTTSCNIGDQNLLWIAGNNQHPVIGQNIYRLKDGRLEQIGQGWLKHGFTALTQDLCDTCNGQGGAVLGVGCSDPYSSSLNGDQARLGPRSEVNALTGVYPYPYILNWQATGNAIFKRVQVQQNDLDPAMNPGALFFVEGHYVTADDAQAGNGYNNASYRRVTVTGSYGLTNQNTTQREKPAILAWAEHGLGVNTPDPSVNIVTVDDPDGGRFYVGSKATDIGGGLWQYDYAVFNLNSDRCGASFNVPIIAGSNITNIGFHDVPYHSDEQLIYDGTDWPGIAGPTSVGWATTPHAVNANANALRWSTMYNFRFVADQPPVNSAATIGLFKPGAGANAILAAVVAPGTTDCNTNGTNDIDDITLGNSEDCNNNLVPDECEFGGSLNQVANPNLAITDNVPAGVNAPAITISSNDIISDLDVGVIIAHTFQGDLKVSLRHVNSNTTAILMDRPGAPASANGFSADNIGDPVGGTSFVFDDEAAAVYDTPGVVAPGTANVTGSWIPDTNALSTFDGLSAAGDWVLNVSDNANVDTGTLVQWSLHFSLDAADCNTNGTADACDILSLGSVDVNLNGVPDECEDCNTNGIPDVSEGLTDCNTNGTADVCDIGSGDSDDCDGNSVPDECEPDCNTNGLADACDITGGLPDCNSDGIPDVCDTDCNTNGLVDGCDIGSGASTDCNNNAIPDECESGAIMESRSPNMPIVDGVTNTDTINVTSGATVVDVNVGVEIRHTWDSDIDINLIHNGSTIILSSDNGGSGDNYTGTVFDDEAGPSIIGGAGLTPFNGSFRPEGLLSTFDGGPAGGAWTISIFDDANGDTGTLLMWSLEIETPSEDCNTNGLIDACEPNDCNTNDIPDECEGFVGGGDDCNTNGTPDSCEPGALPDCNTNGQFDACEAIDDCNNNGIPDECEVGSDCNTNGILDACEAGSGNVDEKQAFNVLIPDNDPLGVDASIVVAASGTITDLNVALIVNHTYQGDVAFTLTHVNSGLSAVLLDRPGVPESTFGYGNNNYGNSTTGEKFILDDEAAAVYDVPGQPEPGITNVTGSWQPSPGSLSTFDGDSVNGTWTLNVADFAGQDSGTLIQWGLTATVAVSDCNSNGIPDACEADCNTNGTPDDCEGGADCNANGTLDVCEIDGNDCNTNGVLDECDPATDCDSNGTPDVCELDGLDCNTNGQLDACEAGFGDCDTNSIPDLCESFADCNTNGTNDVCDTAGGAGDSNGNSVPDECEAGVLTTLSDFYFAGTQEGSLDGIGNDPIADSANCSFCHIDDGFGTPKSDIYNDWQGSMMANAARDPLFRACMQIAEVDAPRSGDMCLRCHSPRGWLGGRSLPTDGSSLTADDRAEGVSCNFCHRMVQKEADIGECDISGATCIDQNIRDALALNGDLPSQVGNANYVVDPLDRRRGPFADAICDQFHAREVRQFFRQAQMCGTCHEVSNPVYTKVGNDYVLNAFNTPHPTGDKYEMFPVERTYSEWLMSDFASPAGIDMGGKFGGNEPVVNNCQSCHMPRGRGDGVAMLGCVVDGPFGSPARLDQPMHFFMGANTWMPDVLINLYPGQVNVASLLANKARNEQMLKNSAEMELGLTGGNDLNVRIYNDTGHKLPTGYTEGRRMWINVVLRDCTGTVIAEYGDYDGGTADLTTANTKVYEAKHGLDAAAAAATGKPQGESFHFVLNNQIVKDNRIPPRGFTNANFASVQSEPVGYSYADGQYWDDTVYSLPSNAATAEVKFYYQTASKEYMEFLRDNNPLPPLDPNNWGQIVYQQWLLTGMSPPVEVSSDTLNVVVKGDFDGDRMVTAADVPLFVNLLLNGTVDPCELYAADFNTDGLIDGDDAQLFLEVLLP